MFADFTLGTTTNRLPGGFASMTFRVDTRGNVRMAGILPNGKTFSRSAPLQLYALDDGTPAAGVPLFAPFVNGRDLLSALVWFSPVVDFVELSVDTGNGWFVTWEDNAPGGYGTVRLALAGYPWRTPPVLRNLALLADPGDIPWYESRAAVASGFLRWDAIKRGIPLTLNTRGTGFTLPRGTAPVLNAGDYDYSAANSARATFSLSASTGVFSGSFNGYLGVTGARGPVLRTARATCRGVLLCQPDGTLAIGAGAGLVAETEPALKALRLKRSFPVMLSPIP